MPCWPVLNNREPNAAAPADARVPIARVLIVPCANRRAIVYLYLSKDPVL